MDQNQMIIDALVGFVGRNMRFVIYPAFPDMEQVNTQKMVVSGVVKEIVEADGGWGKAAQVVFEGGATFLFQSYQTVWEVGEITKIRGRMKGYHSDGESSRYRLIVEIGPAW